MVTATRILLFAAAIIIAGFVVWLVMFPTTQTPHATSTDPTKVLSFDACVAAGYPVTESYPRTCKTPDGRTYAEEIAQTVTYTHADATMITVENPYPGAVTGKTFTMNGKARGPWYFEASFPVTVLDTHGNTIYAGSAKATGDWMTQDFVPFTVDIDTGSYTGPATVVLKKDNPSGQADKDAQISFPITVEY